jgi:uncharacterized protein with von Willebrand factor type A (vWA) domain
MERVLTDYIRALRKAGAGVSTTEALDAARAVALVGYEDRRTLKITLAAALAKTAEEGRLHDRLFDLYFAGAPSRAEETGAAPESDDGLSVQDAVQDLESLAAAPDGAAMAMAMAKAAKAAGVDDIRFASQASYLTGRMLQEMGLEALEKELLDRLGDHTPEGDARAKALMETRARLRRAARAHVDRRYEVFGRSATETFMDEAVAERAISALTQADMARMKIIVARMAKKLAAKHSRRRRVSQRGQLDVRRTLRANAGYDGVPFEVIWKQKRRDRPKIVAVCDVSGSVAQYVRFLLLFLTALRGEVADVQTFAFSQSLKDVGPDLDGASFDAAMEKIVREVGSGSTDYGQAFAVLRAAHWDAIDRSTTLLILGDGRSNYSDPRVDILRDAADQAKRVVWLCPEPPGQWGSGDSCIADYRPFCTSLTHCSTAAELERAIDEMLLAYD